MQIFARCGMQTPTLASLRWPNFLRKSPLLGTLDDNCIAWVTVVASMGYNNTQCGGGLEGGQRAYQLQKFQRSGVVGGYSQHQLRKFQYGGRKAVIIKTKM